MAAKNTLVIDDATAAAIASGASVGALVGSGAGPKAQGSDKDDDKQTTGAADGDEETEGNDDDDDNEGGSGAAEGDDESKGDRDEEKASMTTVAALNAQVVALNDTLIDAKVDLRTITAERDALQVSSKALLEIAREATNKLNVALGGAALDLSALPADAVITQYQAFQTKFNERFKVGGVAQVPNDDGDGVNDMSPAQSAAHLKAVRLRSVGGRGS